MEIGSINQRIRWSHQLAKPSFSYKVRITTLRASKDSNKVNRPWVRCILPHLVRPKPNLVSLKVHTPSAPEIRWQVRISQLKSKMALYRGTVANTPWLSIIAEGTVLKNPLRAILYMTVTIDPQISIYSQLTVSAISMNRRSEYCRWLKTIWIKLISSSLKARRLSHSHTSNWQPVNLLNLKL